MFICSQYTIFFCSTAYSCAPSCHLSNVYTYLSSCYLLFIHLPVYLQIPVAERSKGKNTHSGAERGGQQLVIQFVETKQSICFHELNHKLKAAPHRPAVCVCLP